MRYTPRPTAHVRRAECETSAEAQRRSVPDSDSTRALLCPGSCVARNRGTQWETATMTTWPREELPAGTAPTMSKRIQEIRDPIHVFVRLDGDERKVLDSHPFQRLRHVHQLALTHLVYPGATHKRFEHSLGVMGRAVFEALRGEFGGDMFRRDHYHQRGGSPDFPVRMRDGRKVSSLVVSQALGKVPVTSVDYVFADRSVSSDAERWIAENRKRIVQPPGEDEEGAGNG